MAVSKSQVQVDGIEGPDNAPIQVSYGGTCPAGTTFQAEGGVSLSGILTAVDGNITNINGGYCTASSFVGSGANLTGLPSITEAKAIAFYMIS